MIKRIIIAVCLIFYVTNVAMAKTRVILDSDANNELDDQHAIAYMLFSGNHFDVEGITINRTRSGGNVDKHQEEAERVIKLCGLEKKIKTYKGANGTFDQIKDQVTNKKFDGVEAVDFIIKRAKLKSSRNLVLLPIGKLTNIALALHKEPSIANNLRIVWLGSNYPDPGEYNEGDDLSAVNYLMNMNVPLEVVLVRWGVDSGKSLGTYMVRTSLPEVKKKMPGRGPRVHPPVVGRHGSEFSHFGDYSVELFSKTGRESHALFDMAAVAIVKNSAWASSSTIPAPHLVGDKWVDRPDNRRKITLWANFDAENIMKDFFTTMKNYVLVRD